MSRWHDESYHNPDVYLAGGSTPRCRGCGGSAETMLKRLEQTSLNPFSPIPPDEPVGKMNLRWPSTVRYIQTQPDGTTIELNRPSLQEEDHPPQPISLSPVLENIEPGTQTLQPISPTYGGTLALDQFRLACLSASMTSQQATSFTWHWRFIKTTIARTMKQRLIHGVARTMIVVC